MPSRRARGRGRGDDRLAAADVALDQAHCRLIAKQIGFDIAQRALLRAGQRERQRLDEALRELVRIFERQRRFGARGVLQQLQAELMREQLFEREPPLRRMLAGRHLRELRFARRVVNVVERVFQRGQAQRIEHLRRHPVPHARATDFAQRLVHEGAQAPLREAFGAGIDRSKGFFDAVRPIGGDPPVLGVDDLDPQRPAPDLAEASQPRAAGQRLLLSAREMEEPQREKSGPVGNPAEQLPLAAEHHLRELHFAFDRDARARNQRADRNDLRAIFVTQRQDEQQVLHLIDAQPLQLFGERRADTAHGGDRPLLGGCVAVEGRLSQGRARIRSRRARRAAAAPRRPPHAPGRAASSTGP